MKVAARARLVLGAALPVALWPAATLAAGPTTDRCIDANEDGQDLRREGSLLEARARLAVCVAPSCPGPVRDDCVERLRALNDAIPTIVLDATDGAGADLPRVLVTLDGHSVPASTAAGAIPVDPGPHRLLFESDGHTATPLTIVAREGEKDRYVHAALAIRTPVGGGNMQHPLGLVLGGVGLLGLATGGLFAALAKSTYDHALSGECGGNPNGCSASGESDGRSAQAQARTSTIALIGGGVLLSAGAVIYFTAPTGAPVSLAPTVGTDRTGLSLRGAF
jgi:hypothetical protein